MPLASLGIVADPVVRANAMTTTTVDLLPPVIHGSEVTFRWTVSPRSELYHKTSFTTSFPESVDTSTIPERLWWMLMILALHSHWILLRPCKIRMPIRLEDGEVEFWHRLLDTYVATAEGQRGVLEFDREIQLVSGDHSLEPLTPLAENGRFATAFSGGKDSLVQAALLHELGHNPILVATTSPMPEFADHSTRHRWRVFEETQRRTGLELLEVRSDLRGTWDNQTALRMGYPFGINEIADTFLYTAVTAAVGYARGATHLFLASENEVSQNQIVAGRFSQHRHFMYSATTQAAIRAILAPVGFWYGSLTTPLHSSQIQELLTLRYRSLRDLQYSCWNTTEERRACSVCGECKRLGWIVMALGESPADQGIDLLHMLNNYGDPVRTTRIHTYDPNASVSARMERQIARSLAAIQPRQVLAHLAKTHPTSLVSNKGRNARRQFALIQKLVLERHPPDSPPGFRAGYLETVDPAVRAALTAIFEQHFPPEPEENYADQLARQRTAIAHIVAPLTTSTT